MNGDRPIDPQIFWAVTAWCLGMLFVAGILTAVATRGQRFPLKLLYLVGAACLLTAPASLGFRVLLIAWYGGKPNATLGSGGTFYVREKHRLTPISPEEFAWLERVHRSGNGWLLPSLSGAACIAAGQMLRRRTTHRDRDAAAASNANPPDVPARDTARDSSASTAAGPGRNRG